MRWLVVGNPESNRIAYFQQALEERGYQPAEVVSYRDLLRGRQIEVSRDAILRIESPGKDFEVERLLLAKGAEGIADENVSLSLRDVEQLQPDRGLILYPRQRYRGYRALLGEFSDQLRGTENVQLMNAPADIATMFDKVLCHQMMLESGISVPLSLGKVGSYDELTALMADAEMDRVFVKLAHSSSASGVVAFHCGKERQRAFSTVELVREDDRVWLYNSRKIRCYTNVEEIATIINELCRHRVHVEQWLPKATIEGDEFDLRVMVIGGRVQHVVVRVSDSPMTNLHLLNRRGDTNSVIKRLGGVWDDIERTCRRVMQLFPQSLYAGVDVIVSPHCREHAVLEVNAFGDLLPGVTHDGRSTYAAEIEALVATLT